MENGPGDLKSIKGELPIGLGMRIMQDRVATDRYDALPEAEKKKILSYVEGAGTGEEAERRVTKTVQSLHDGITGFYNEPPAAVPPKFKPSVEQND